MKILFDPSPALDPSVVLEGASHTPSGQTPPSTAAPQPDNLGPQGTAAVKAGEELPPISIEALEAELTGVPKQAVDIKEKGPATHENQETLEEQNKRLAEAKKQEETVKELQKQESEKTTKETKTPAEQTEKPSTTKLSRDLEGLDEEEQKIFKSMDNNHYNRLIKPYREYKAKVATQLSTITKERDTLKQQNEELSKGIVKMPDSYYEHPEAFKASPEHQRILGEYQVLSDIQSHWEQQLEKIEEGKDWQPLSQNDKGEIVVLKERPATAKDKIQVQKFLAGANSAVEEKKNEYQQAQQKFQGKHNELKSFVGELCKKYWPSFTDEELSKPENKAVKEAMEKAVATLPPELRGNITNPLLQRAYITILAQEHELKELRKLKEAKQLQARDKQIRQPSSTESTITTGDPQKNPFALAEAEGLKV